MLEDITQKIENQGSDQEKLELLKSYIDYMNKKKIDPSLAKWPYQILRKIQKRYPKIYELLDAEYKIPKKQVDYQAFHSCFVV